MCEKVRCKNFGNMFDGKYCPVCGARKKASGLIIVLLSIALMVVVVALSSRGNDKPTAVFSTGESRKASSLSASAPVSYADTQYDAELSSGHYTAGIDFPAGEYDIVAVSGGGNVSSSNAYSGSLNAIMGTEERNAAAGGSLYRQKYENIRLPEGTERSISGGVTVKISSDAASGAPLRERNQSIKEEVILGNGHFIAGEDFPGGVYDIVAVSGSGNVSSSNMFHSGLSEIMGTAGANAAFGYNFYQQEFKNAAFEKGVELSIDGVQVKLVPSK